MLGIKPRSHIVVSSRVKAGPMHHVGSVRYIEDGAACVKWDDMSKIYTYELSRLRLATARDEQLNDEYLRAHAPKALKNRVKSI